MHTLGRGSAVARKRHYCCASVLRFGVCVSVLRRREPFSKMASSDFYIDTFRERYRYRQSPTKRFERLAKTRSRDFVDCLHICQVVWVSRWMVHSWTPGCGCKLCCRCDDNLKMVCANHWYHLGQIVARFLTFRWWICETTHWSTWSLLLRNAMWENYILVYLAIYTAFIQHSKK